MDEKILAQAKTLLNKGDLKKALQLYQELIVAEPQNALGYQDIAAILGDLGKFSDSLSMSKKALDIDANLVTPHIIMAYTYDRLGEKEKSWEEARIALEKDPELPAALCCSGILSLLDNKLDDATRYLEKAVENDHAFYTAQYNLAAVYQARGDRKKYFVKT